MTTQKRWPKGAESRRMNAIALALDIQYHIDELLKALRMGDAGGVENYARRIDSASAGIQSHLREAAAEGREG